MLARRFGLSSDIAGRVRMEITLKAQGDSGKALLTDGQRHLDFGLWPQQLEAGLFDLWAVNLVGAITSGLQSCSYRKRS